MQELQPSRGEQIGEEVTPVTLPPGRFRLATSPSLTGSVPSVNTIGIVAVAAFAASAATGETVPITATCRRTSSAANAGSRSYWPLALRYSNVTLLPSTNPDWLRPSRIAVVRVGSSAPSSNPTRGSDACGCARATSGQAAAAPLRS